MACFGKEQVLGRRSPLGRERRRERQRRWLAALLEEPTCTCVLCRPSPDMPELSFHFVLFLGWSTRHLALDPSAVMCLQHKLCTYLDALQPTCIPRPQPVPRQLVPATPREECGQMIKSKVPTDNIDTIREELEGVGVRCGDFEQQSDRADRISSDHTV
jgi:hypothetical protein